MGHSHIYIITWLKKKNVNFLNWYFGWISPKPVVSKIKPYDIIFCINKMKRVFVLICDIIFMKNKHISSLLSKFLVA